MCGVFIISYRWPLKNEPVSGKTRKQFGGGSQGRTAPRGIVYSFSKGMILI